MATGRKKGTRKRAPNQKRAADSARVARNKATARAHRQLADLSQHVRIMDMRLESMQKEHAAMLQKLDTRQSDLINKAGAALRNRDAMTDEAGRQLKLMRQDMDKLIGSATIIAMEERVRVVLLAFTDEVDRLVRHIEHVERKTEERAALITLRAEKKLSDAVDRLLPHADVLVHEEPT